MIFLLAAVFFGCLAAVYLLGGIRFASVGNAVVGALFAVLSAACLIQAGVIAA